jgi:hypothetical protein
VQQVLRDDIVISVVEGRLEAAPLVYLHAAGGGAAVDFRRRIMVKCPSDTFIVTVGCCNLQQGGKK